MSQHLQAGPLCSQVEAGEGTCVVGDMVITDKLRASLLGLSTLALPVVTRAERDTWKTATSDTGIDRIPTDTVQVMRNALRQDRTRRSVFVRVTTPSVYIADRGGLTDEIIWYGPISLDAIDLSCKG